MSFLSGGLFRLLLFSFIDRDTVKLIPHIDYYKENLFIVDLHVFSLLFLLRYRILNGFRVK